MIEYPAREMNWVLGSEKPCGGSFHVSWRKTRSKLSRSINSSRMSSLSRVNLCTFWDRMVTPGRGLLLCTIIGGSLCSKHIHDGGHLGWGLTLVLLDLYTLSFHAERVDLRWCLESHICGDSQGLLESSSLLSFRRESAPHLLVGE